MTTKHNDFEGGGAAGGAGTAITTINSGSGSGDAFAIVTLPTGGTSSFTFDTTGMNPAGTFGGRWQIASATGGGWRTYLAWTAAGTTVAARIGFCLNTLPAVNIVVACIINGSFTTNCRLLFTTSGHTIQTNDAAGGALGGNTAVTAGVPYVWEVQLNTGTANNNGTINSQVYALSAPGSLLINYVSGGTENAGGVSGATVEQPIRLSAGNNDLVANLDATFDDLLFITGQTTPVGPPSAPVDATVTMGSALAVTTARPAPQLMSLTSPAYAATATDLGGGTGSWVNPTNAQGAPDTTFATWTAP